jgi:ABC-2 type transport system permease protein
MNLTLFATMLRMHGKKIFGISLVSFFYLWMLISVFPSFSTEDVEMIMKKMPEEIMKAFGFEKGFTNLTEFLSGEYYGFLYLIIMMIFSVMTAIQLVARLVDRGSMAYLLTSSVSRLRVAVTQALVLLFGLFMIGLFTTLGGITGDQIILEKPELDVSRFVELNLVGFLLFSVVAGYSFLFSCLFNDDRKAMSLSGILTTAFYAMDLVGKLSDKMEWLRSLTIFSLFEPMKIVRGEVDLWANVAVLGGLTALLFACAILIFVKRDLPL